MRKRRGVTLILALFTVVVLVILSITFLALAHNESRNSRSGYYQKAALNAANFALDYLINYMGYSGPPSRGGVYQQVSLSNLRYTLAPTNGSGGPFDASGNFMNYPLRVTAVGNSRLITFGPRANPTRIPIGNDLEAIIEMTFDETALSGTGVPIGQAARYAVTIRTQVFTRGATEPVASRQVDVRLKEEFPTEYTHILENWVSWDAQGILTGSRDDMAFKIGIPSGQTDDEANYRERGKVRVEGHLGSEGYTNAWFDASGRIRYDRFFDPQNADSFPLFDRRTAINKNTNIIGNNTPGNPVTSVSPVLEGSIFSGGIDRNQVHRGLPQADEPNEPFPYISRRRGNEVAGGFAQLKAGQGQTSGYIEIDSTGGIVANGPGATYSYPEPSVSSGVADNDTYPAQLGENPGTKTVVGNMVEVDPRSRSANELERKEASRVPGIPNVVVTLGGGQNGDQVEVKVVGKYSGRTVNLISGKKVSDFQNGVLYVKGGNVVVETVGDFSGHLTVVSGEGTDREAVSVDGSGNQTFSPATSIYHQRAREFFEERDADGNQVNLGVQGPPYTAAQLGLSDPNPNRLYYPPPKPGTEREGNLVIGSDINYKQSTPTLLGLAAQNFVLLNDKNYHTELPAPNLEVDASIVSFEHSVQFDWDNTAGNPNFVFKHDVQKNLVGIPRLDQNGNPIPGSAVPSEVTIGGRTFSVGELGNVLGRFTLNGSVISRFADTEGAYLTFTGYPKVNYGYTKQTFDFNPYQASVTPPFFPRWSVIKEGVFPRYLVENYQDRGSYSAEGALN